MIEKALPPSGKIKNTMPNRALDYTLIEQAQGLDILQGSLADHAAIVDAQDLSERKVIALIAYLQRLGVDLTRPAPTDESGETASVRPATGELPGALSAADAGGSIAGMGGPGLIGGGR